ncbi:MAG: hypothetical protein M1485_02685 [Chloroflexi bacterium]|nr:hypothetical protein [Chloroflexota bacterium]
MNNLSPFLTLNCSCNEALQWTSQNLTQNGLRVMQTFDLHNARHALKDCPCPHHGTSECDCQMVVLLVYGKADGPVTLILHGYEGQTWLSLASSPPQRVNPIIQSSIEQALQMKFSG